MGQLESSMYILPRTISHDVEHRNWQPIHEFLHSSSIHPKIKRAVLMNVSRGKFKSPFLNLACSYNAPRTVIAAAVKIGGKNLLLRTNVNGENILHCYIFHPLERCQMFLDVAGKDILFTRTNSGLTPLHVLFYGRHPYIQEIELYIKYGGKELLYLKDDKGRNILHTALERMKKANIISFLIHLGGKDLVIEKDKDGLIPLDYFFLHWHGPHYRRNDVDDDGMIDLFTLFIQTAGFDECAGGLFMSNEDCPIGIRSRMTMGNGWISQRRESAVRWCLIYGMPCISQNIVKIVSSVFHGEPLLQLAIPFLSKDCLVQIIQEFKGCMNTRDKHGKLPLEVAVDMDLAWYRGMKELLAATVSEDEHGRSQLVVACTFGFKWKSGGGVGRILADCKMEELYQLDPISGLYPALLLAASRGSDVEAIYNLIRREPGILCGANRELTT
jgi:hypothetical protein